MYKVSDKLIDDLKNALHNYSLCGKEVVFERLIEIYEVADSISYEAEFFEDTQPQ